MRTVLTVLFAANAFAQTATPHALTTELQKIRMTVVLKDGRLTGTGADLLHKELASTQFFMIAEEHGTAEIPRFHKALLQEAWKNGYRHVALEVGPLALARISSYDDARKSNLAHPFGFPFLGWKEDAEVFDAAMKLGGGRRETVWGIDQEFVFYATAHLERLLSLAKTDAQRAAAMKALERARAGDAELAATKNPAKLLMLSATAAELDELRRAFKGGDAAAVRLIEALDDAYASAVALLGRVTEAELQPVKFFSGPGQMQDYPAPDFLWFMLLDQIHHRGQFSVYLRMSGGKVPSIYGPSADEPWT